VKKARVSIGKESEGPSGGLKERKGEFRCQWCGPCGEGGGLILEKKRIVQHLNLDEGGTW